VLIHVIDEQHQRSPHAARLTPQCLPRWLDERPAVLTVRFPDRIGIGARLH
jgi:hypothetical protein